LSGNLLMLCVANNFVSSGWKNAQICYVYQKLVVDNQSLKWAKYEIKILLRHFVCFFFWQNVPLACKIKPDQYFSPKHRPHPRSITSIDTSLTIQPDSMSWITFYKATSFSSQFCGIYIPRIIFSKYSFPLLKPNHWSCAIFLISHSVLLHYSIMTIHIQQRRNKKSLRRIFSVKHIEQMVRFLSVSFYLYVLYLISSFSGLCKALSCFKTNGRQILNECGH